MVCRWCREPKTREVYLRKWADRCACDHDHRTPLEKRQDAIMAAHGDQPAAFTPEVLAAIANGPIYDGATHYCPAGKLSMAETKAREAAIIEPPSTAR